MTIHSICGFYQDLMKVSCQVLIEITSDRHIMCPDHIQIRNLPSSDQDWRVSPGKVGI